MATRWSSYVATPVAGCCNVSSFTPCTTNPSSSSETSTPNFANSCLMAAIRLHSLTRWLAMPVMVESPGATAATTVAVRNASVMGSMSMWPNGCKWPTGGPWTDVENSSWCTWQPMARNTPVANRASPWNEDDPMLGIVHLVPVSAANANGYVADDASDSTTYSAGFLYLPSGISYVYFSVFEGVTWMPNWAIISMVILMYV